MQFAYQTCILDLILGRGTIWVDIKTHWQIQPSSISWSAFFLASRKFKGSHESLFERQDPGEELLGQSRVKGRRDGWRSSGQVRSHFKVGMTQAFLRGWVFLSFFLCFFCNFLIFPSAVFYRMLVAYPQTKIYFSHWGDLSPNNPQVKKHGATIMAAVGKAVKNIDDLTNHLSKLSELHASQLRVDPANFKVTKYCDL